MKIGSKEWLKRERDWLVGDIESQLGLIEHINTLKPWTQEMKDQENDHLVKLRQSLKLLRENPKAYERQIKEKILSRLPIREQDA